MPPRYPPGCNLRNLERGGTPGEDTYEFVRWLTEDRVPADSACLGGRPFAEHYATHSRQVHGSSAESRAVRTAPSGVDVHRSEPHAPVFTASSDDDRGGASQAAVSGVDRGVRPATRGKDRFSSTGREVEKLLKRQPMELTIHMRAEFRPEPDAPWEASAHLH